MEQKFSRNSAKMLQTQLALLEQCGNNFSQFLDQMNHKNNYTVNNSLHPSILMKQLSREPLPKSADGRRGELLLHQAVHTELQNAKPRGLISLAQLIEMGFDINALDSNGESAIDQLFETSCQSAKAQTIIRSFLRS